MSANDDVKVNKIKKSKLAYKKAVVLMASKQTFTCSKSIIEDHGQISVTFWKLKKYAFFNKT